MSNLTGRGIHKEINKNIRPIISIGFDDGHASDEAIALPVLRENGIRATFFVCGRDGERTASYWIKDHQIKNLADEGQEIGCHTTNHENLRELTESEILETWINNKKHLEGITGKPVRTHSYPWGYSTQRADHLAGAVFEATRGTGNDTISHETDFSGYPNPLHRLSRVKPYGRRDVYNTPAIGVDGFPQDQIERLVDGFLDMEEPGLMNLYLHRLYEDEDSTKPTDRKSQSEFRQMVEYIASKKEQGLVDVLPFYEASRRIMTAQSIYL